MFVPTDAEIREAAERWGWVGPDQDLDTKVRALVVQRLTEPEQDAPAPPRPRLINRTSTPAFGGQLVVEVWHVPDAPEKENRTHA